MSRNRTRTAALIALAAAVAPVASTRATVTGSGDFYSEVTRLRNLAFGADSNLYVAPTQFFMMAGAQRNANGTGTADVAHLVTSIFLGVHQAWNGFTGQVPAYQVHGFNEHSDSLSNFPGDISSVIADGTGSVTSRLITLDN